MNLASHGSSQTARPYMPDPVLVSGLLAGLADVDPSGKSDFARVVMESIGPEDGVEFLLAAQMAALHIATMEFARRAVKAESYTQRDITEKSLNRLARTFAAQALALKRYRAIGQRSVAARDAGFQPRAKGPRAEHCAPARSAPAGNGHGYSTGIGYDSAFDPMDPAPGASARPHRRP